MKSQSSFLNAIVAMLAISAIVVCPAETHGQEHLEITGMTMGPITYKVIIAHHPDTITPKELQTKVDASLERVNGLMSTYIPESDVSRFNDSASTEFLDVESETAVVVARAIEISKQTEGAFDITVGPAVNLWNFGPGKTDFKLPSDEAINSVRELIGFRNLEVRLDPPAIKKLIPGLKIDLSAIAKGYAVDHVTQMLDGVGCRHFMVEVGGEVMTRGERAVGGSWRIGVERPTERGRKINGVAEISNKAMATSGDYRNFVEHDGKRFSHTIDPTTCRPVTHALASACVITDDCMTADALATAVIVLGVKRGELLCQSLGVEYLMVERDSDFGQDLTEHVSEEFPLKKKPTPANSGLQSIWPTFIGAAVVFGFAVLAMAVGSIFANKPVAGSCGGLANMSNEEGDAACGVCSQPATDCVETARETVQNG